MIQTYDQIFNQAMKINQLIEQSDGSTYIQKIYSTSRYICFSLRTTGKTYFLYIGRGNGYEGMWITQLRPESFLRKVDALLEYIRKMLGGAIFEGIVVDKKDRIISLKYLKNRSRNYMNFFYSGRDLYFSNYFYSIKEQEMKLFVSWENKLFSCDEENINNFFDDVGRRELEKNIDSHKEIKTIEKLLDEEKLKAGSNKEVAKKQKFQKRKISKIRADLEKVSRWSELEQELLKIESLEDYQYKSVIAGFKLTFKEKTHYKRRDEVYQKIKKLKKAEEFLKRRLNEATEKTSKEKAYENTLNIIKPIWKVKKVSQKQSLTQDGSYKIFNFENLDIGVGLSTQGNDSLRSIWAKKDDIWFHLEGDKSPHIIIKLKNGAGLEESIFAQVAGALVEFSKLSYTEVNIIYTKVKNLKGVKGSSGKVIYKKEKHIKVQVNSHWRDS